MKHASRSEADAALNDLVRRIGDKAESVDIHQTREKLQASLAARVGVFNAKYLKSSAAVAELREILYLAFAVGVWDDRPDDDRCTPLAPEEYGGEGGY